MSRLPAVLSVSSQRLHRCFCRARLRQPRPAPVGQASHCLAALRAQRHADTDTELVRGRGSLITAHSPTVGRGGAAWTQSPSQHDTPSHPKAYPGYLACIWHREIREPLPLRQHQVDVARALKLSMPFSLREKKKKKDCCPFLLAAKETSGPSRKVFERDV